MEKSSNTGSRASIFTASCHSQQPSTSLGVAFVVTKLPSMNTRRTPEACKFCKACSNPLNKGVVSGSWQRLLRPHQAWRYECQEVILPEHSAMESSCQPLSSSGTLPILMQHFCCIKSINSSTKSLFWSRLVLDWLQLPVPQYPVCSVSSYEQWVRAWARELPPLLS